MKTKSSIFSFSNFIFIIGIVFALLILTNETSSASLGYNNPTLPQLASKISTTSSTSTGASYYQNDQAVNTTSSPTFNNINVTGIVKGDRGNLQMQKAIGGADAFFTFNGVLQNGQRSWRPAHNGSILSLSLLMASSGVIAGAEPTFIVNLTIANVTTYQQYFTYFGSTEQHYQYNYSNRGVLPFKAYDDIVMFYDTNNSGNIQGSAVLEYIYNE